MTMPLDAKQPGSTPLDAPTFTQRKDFSFTPENVARRIGVHISSPDQLPTVDRSELEGKVAVITGSTRGIGAATAMVFAEYGMKVVINGRGVTPERGKMLVENISAHGGDAVFIPADVSTSEGARFLMDVAMGAFGRIDVVVNNAGTIRDNLVMLMKQDEWYDVMRSNADSAFFVTQAAARLMMKNKDPQGGMIIFDSSVGQEGFPGQINYAASKRAMEAIAEVTAQDPVYVRRGICTSIFRIGLTNTELTSSMTGEQKQALLDVLPSHREFSPEEIAKCMPFLATLKESGHILTLA
ncbi:MAG: SDR family NAD(P)-dependent oxidoreductase [Candidatus Levyibacteriota bacterium]